MPMKKFLKNKHSIMSHILCFGVDTYDMKEVELRWADDDPVELYAEKLHLPNFNLIGNHHTDCTEGYKTGNNKYMTHFQCSVHVC